MANGKKAGARQPGTFRIKDCALVALATGKKARLLQEFRHELGSIALSSIYHHFWGGLLQPRFEEREYNNDFAAWVQHGIHDTVLAERLAAIDPTGCADLEVLRRDIIELIDARMDEVEHLSWTRATQQFEFISSQIVIFDTRRRVEDPAGLAAIMGQLSTSSIFYHFIDARRRMPDGKDDFSEWLGSFGDRHEELVERLAGIDPYFGSLSELRGHLAGVFAACIPEAVQ